MSIYTLQFIVGLSLLLEDRRSSQCSSKMTSYTTKKIMSYQFDNKERKRYKYWSFLNASSSHEQWISHLAHVNSFLSIFWSLYNFTIHSSDQWIRLIDSWTPFTIFLLWHFLHLHGVCIRLVVAWTRHFVRALRVFSLYTKKATVL